MGVKETEEALPGVTLTLSSARRFEVEGKHKVTMTIEGLIDNEEVWAQVEKMFINGFRVYSVATFKEDLIDVFRTEVEQLERQVQMKEYENIRLRRENELLRTSLEEKKGVLDGFARQFGQ